MHSKLQRPTERGFPIARTRIYSACVRNDFELMVDINDMEILNRLPTFDGGSLFCAPDDVVSRLQT